MAEAVVIRHSRWRWFGRGVVAVVTFGCLAFGGTYPWASASIAGLMALFGLRALTKASSIAPSGALAKWTLIVALAVAVQLIPWPHSVFAAIDPGAERFLNEFRVGYAFAPSSWQSLSIEPADTARVLALFLSFAVFMVGLVRAFSYVRLESLARRLTMLGAIVAAFALLQRAVGPTGRMALGRPAPLIYGFWQPEQGGSPFGPFVNHNHYAGWMLMLAPVAAAYCCGLCEDVLDRLGGDWRAFVRWLMTPEASRLQVALVSLFVMAVSVVLSGSRSGMLGLSLGMAVMAFAVARRVGGVRGWTVAGVVMTALVAGALASGGSEQAITRFLRAPVDFPARLAAWRDTLRIASDFPWFGTGLGTYKWAMLVYQTSDRSEIFFQAHNDYLQLLAEGGALVLVPVIGLLTLVVRTIRAQFAARLDAPRARWIRIGAVAGLAGIAVQSTLEFSLQLMGNVALLAVLLGLAMHVARPPQPAAVRVAER